MRKGFTMIELIFVIVILGILAAVAIPRLAATRDDAEVSKAATNIQTMVSDLGSYYTSQAGFSSTLSDMTGVASPVKLKDAVCFSVDTTNISNANGTIGASVQNATSGICQRLWQLPGLAELKTKIARDNDTLKFGGVGVQY